MDINEIRKDYREGKYNFRMDIPAKLKENHVFDADLTIKQNKEMIEEHNKKVDELRKEMRKKNVELSQKLTNDVVAYILNNYNINETQARIIEGFVYNDKHSCMEDYFSYIDIISEMVEKVIKEQ